MNFPLNVTVRMRREDVLATMDDYDDDCLDEEAADHLDIEVGNSMETIEVDSMEDLHDALTDEYSGFVIADEDVCEEYENWSESHA